MKIELVDALLLRLQRGLHADPWGEVEAARVTFGESADYGAIVEALDQIPEAHVPLIDFSLLESLGGDDRVQRLVERSMVRAFVVMIGTGLAARHADSGLFTSVPTVEVKRNGVLQRMPTSPWGDGPEEAVAELISDAGTVQELRRRLVQSRFAAYAEGGIREPPEGRGYIRLADGSAANIWLDVKRIFADPLVCFEAAYHIGVKLTEGFQTSLEPSIFLTGSNTGYLLATYLQMLFPEKRVLLIDRLGPFPHLSRMRIGRYDALMGMKACVVEDVLSTGRELDLVALFAFLHHAEVVSAACVYDLEVARPQLVTPKRLFPLSRPSQFLDYERFPMYQVSDEIAS